MTPSGLVAGELWGLRVFRIAAFSEAVARLRLDVKAMAIGLRVRSRDASGDRRSGVGGLQS